MNFDRKTVYHDTARLVPDVEPVAPGRRPAGDGLVGGRAALPSGLLLRKRVGEAPRETELAPDTDAIDRAERGGGTQLPAELRERFEASLGHDLGDVRVHTGGDSATAADAVNARAFATGNHIHFAHGEYNPGTSDGQRLLAHEVVHTVQQAGAAPHTQHKLTVSSPGDAHEVEADALAEDMIAARPVAAGPSSLGGGAVARKPVTSAPRGIHRWAASARHGFRRSASVPWCKENSADPWNHGPNDYVAVGSAVPAPAGDQPADIAPMMAGRWPEPLNGLNADGGMYELPPAVTVDKANAAIDALERVVGEVVATHNGMASKIRDYGTASAQVKPDGFYGPAPSGLNWGAPKDGAPANAGQLAEKQVAAGGKTSTGEVFGGGDKVQGIDDKTIAAGQQKKVSDLLEAARGKDLAVKDACLAYRQHVRDNIGNAVRGVQTAFIGLQMKAEKDKKEDAEDKKAELEEQKKDVLETIGTAGKVIEKGSKWLEGDIGATRELIQLAAEKVVSAQYEPEINAQKEIIKGCRSKIRALEQSLVGLQVEGALNALTASIENLAAKRQAAVTALKAKQDAYDAAAAEAKQQATAHGASPEQADRMQAAIAAIPRIEIVLAKLKDITAAGNVPAYDPTAGLAYAVGRNGNQGINAPAFERGIGSIKGYHDRYAAQTTSWQSRLDSAKAIEAGLNVSSSTAK